MRFAAQYLKARLRGYQELLISWSSVEIPQLAIGAECCVHMYRRLKGIYSAVLKDAAVIIHTSSHDLGTRFSIQRVAPGVLILVCSQFEVNSYQSSRKKFKGVLCSACKTHVWTRMIWIRMICVRAMAVLDLANLAMPRSVPQPWLPTMCYTAYKCMSRKFVAGRLYLLCTISVGVFMVNRLCNPFRHVHAVLVLVLSLSRFVCFFFSHDPPGFRSLCHTCMLVGLQCLGIYSLNSKAVLLSPLPEHH